MELTFVKQVIEAVKIKETLDDFDSIKPPETINPDDIFDEMSDEFWDKFKETLEEDIIPEDYLTEEQIDTIKEQCEKLGLSEDETESKIKEYAQKAKACKEAEEMGLDNLSTREKGNYGEMKTDLDMLDKGYIRISKDGVTSLGDSLKQGIDGVYQNPDGNPPYVITDSKYGSSQLQDTKDGKQLSDTWIDERLDDAVGKEKADEIRDAMLDDDVGVAVANVDADGNITYNSVDSNGDYTNKEVFKND